MKIPSLLMASLLLAGCAPSAAESDSLGDIAADYVQMQLEIGEREPGYVDFYYGPREWQDAAKAAPRSLPDLAVEAAALSGRLKAIDTAALDPMERRRKAFLLSQLRAAQTRLRMLRGEKLSFVEEAEGLFGVRVELKDLAAYDPVIAKIEKLVPGTGPLDARVVAFQDRFTIPKERLGRIFSASIAECKRRTGQHIALPQGEHITQEFVTDQVWSGYNWYKGGYHSLVQVNTDLPIRIDRAVDLGCHEGYPGHHLFFSLQEQRLTKGRGWVEFSVSPIFSPLALIAEGTANYGIRLAFPDEERLRFETRVLYPLAGLQTTDAARFLALLKAIDELSSARFTIASDFLDGRIDRAEAVRRTQRYLLVSKERAEQIMDFIQKNRSYVINYGLGQDLARAYVEAAGDTPRAQWAAFERILSEPTIPSDLLARP